MAFLHLKNKFDGLMIFAGVLFILFTHFAITGTGGRHFVYSSIAGNDDRYLIQSVTEADTTLGEVFITAEPNKSQAYQGESFVLDYKLYHCVPISEFVMYAEPSLEGCLKERLSFPSTDTYKLINGRRYHVVTLQRFSVEPQQAGLLVLSPLKASLKVKLPPDSDDFFAVERTQVYKLASQPIKFKVVPLPVHNQPDNFTGAVGIFQLETILKQDTTKADQRFVFRIVLKGKGNFKNLRLPEPDFPKGIDIYPLIEKDYSQKSLTGYAGEKRVAYTIMSPYSGNFMLAPVSFSYFDPQQKKYTTLITQPHQLTFTGGKTLPVILADAASNKLKIKTTWSASRNISRLWHTTDFYVLLISSLLLYTAVYSYSKFGKSLYLNSFLFKRLAVYSARIKLLKLQFTMAKIERDEFYKRLLSILHQFLILKLNLKIELSTKDIIVLVNEKAQGIDLRFALIDLMEDLNRTRFSKEWPIFDRRSEHLFQTIRLIVSLNKEI